MSLKLRPLADNILVKRFKKETITAGGIHVPESSQDKTQTGAVIAVGEGRLMTDGTIRPLKIMIGDTVVFGKYSGTDVEISGEDYLVLKEADLLGVIEQ